MFKTRRYRPLIEPLEDRSLLSCTVFAQGDTLFVQSDMMGDHFKLTFEHKQASVACNDAPAVTFDGISRIVADLGAGQDNFDAYMDPTPTPWASFSLRLSTGADADVVNVKWLPGAQDSAWIDLGDGNDLFNADIDLTLDPNLPEAPSLNMSVFGGLGRDRITSRIGIQPTPFHKMVDLNLSMDGGAGDDILSENTDIDPSALVGFNPQPEPPIIHVGVEMDGGDGSDRITSRWGVGPEPFHKAFDLDLSMDGGVGDDALDAQFSDHKGSQNVADLRVALLGGDGNDALSLLLTPGAFDAAAFADGGAGFDTGLFSHGVKHKNVEQVG
jgi:hypothetical protein